MSKLEDRFLPYCDHEYANREDNAANCADEANEHAIAFAKYIHNNPHIFNNGWSMEMVLDYFNKEYNQ